MNQATATNERVLEALARERAAVQQQILKSYLAAKPIETAKIVKETLPKRSKPQRGL